MLIAEPPRSAVRGGESESRAAKGGEEITWKKEKKKVEGVWRGGGGGGETTLKVTELSVPHIAGIPPARPIRLSNFIKQLPSKTYKQASSCEGEFQGSTTQQQAHK